MKKIAVMILGLFLVQVAQADIYITPIVSYGIDAAPGATSFYGIVPNVAGTEIRLTIYDGGGDGVDGGVVGIIGGVPTASGNDTIIGYLTSAATGGGDFADYGALFAGEIGGNGTPWSADTWVSVSGINVGDDAWLSTITITDGNYTDPKTLPEYIAVDGGVAQYANTVVVPEPASIGLLGLVSGGIFFTRRFFPAV